MSIRHVHRSFGGGEISPDLAGRIDDAKVQSGVALCRNFIVTPQGPVENRAGFEFVRAVKDSTKATRLIPFTYSTTQTMVIEIGAGYFRFHTMGATLLLAGVPYEVVSPYAEAELFDIHYVQSADVLTLVHPSHPPRELRRLGPTNWTLTAVAFTPTVTAPLNVRAKPRGFTVAKYDYSYVVCAIGADGVQESVASKIGSNGATIQIWLVTQANPAVFSTLSPHGLTVADYVGISGAIGMPQINGSFTVDTTPSATTFTLKDLDGVVVDSTSYPTYADLTGTLRRLVRGNLFETGSTNTISWDAVALATRYNVYKLQGGIYGYIGETAGLSIVDDNIAPDLSKTPPLYDTAMQAAGDYPGAVSYYEQRRCFAGSIERPQVMTMTKSGTESNLSYSLPVRDDDRVAFRVAAREANTIRHIVPLTQLLLLTSSAEWRVTSVNSDAITPSTISVRPQSYVGASNVQPVTVNNTCIYGAARGGHVQEIGYNWQANGFVTGDLSLRSAHLFDNYSVRDIAYAKAPMPIVWMVSSSGKLLGFTYVPEQQVGAWHQHDTDGVFESCTAVAEGNEDSLYCVVRRTVNGASVRYVERMASRQFDAAQDAFFVDCGLSYSGLPVTSFAGLGHLEGKEVAILADGAVHPRRTVVAGAVTLDNAASVVHVGLPITADLQTMPLAAQTDGGFAQGRVKNVNKAWLRVLRSSGIFVGPDVDKLTEAKQRTTELYGSPPELKTAEIPVMLTPSWQDGAQVFVRQRDPLPLTVLAMTVEFVLGA